MSIYMRLDLLLACNIQNYLRNSLDFAWTSQIRSLEAGVRRFSRSRADAPDHGPIRVVTDRHMGGTGPTMGGTGRSLWRI